MRVPFLERLEKDVLVCDGAMGTQLYARGVFLNRCYDELNLSRPDLIREIHREYFWAGADILETNTFGANRLKLEPHGLSDRVREINEAGVRLAREVAGDSAYVAGSLGPLGIRVEPYGRLGVDEARRIFAEQVTALAGAGVDLISLETFYDLNELHAAILACRDASTLPLMAQITLEEDGNSLEGTPPEQFGLRLEEWGADVVGVNCSVGPQVMLDSIERMSRAVSCRLVAQPNAGRPRSFEGRNLYLSSPEYFASYARRFVRAGVRIVGGCCGTTPAHIRAIRDAVRSQSPVSKGPVQPAARAAPVREAESVPCASRSRLARALHERRFVVAAAITTPRGTDASAALAMVRRLGEGPVEVVRILQAPPGSASPDALAVAALAAREANVEPVLHYLCTGKSLLTMQSEILGAHALGLRNLVLTNGEPVRIGDYLDAAAAFDVDSIGVTHLVSALNAGTDLGGKSIGKPTEWLVGTLVDPCAPDLESEIRRMEYAVEAGAHFAVSRPVFDAESMERFRERTRHCRVPLIAGIRVLTTYAEAEYLHNEVPGITIPEGLLKRLGHAGTEAHARQEGIAIARELREQITPAVEGIEVQVRQDVSLVFELLEG